MVERRQTNQRQWVLDAIKDRGHLSAQEVYDQICLVHPDISVATVYRNLNILVETGLVQVVGHTSQKEIFDARTDSHAHFICRACGRIFDTESEPPLKAVAALEQAGHRVLESRTTLFGLCADCGQASPSH